MCTQNPIEFTLGSKELLASETPMVCLQRTFVIDLQYMQVTLSLQTLYAMDKPRHDMDAYSGVAGSVLLDTAIPFGKN